jgi:hypothetical protein
MRWLADECVDAPIVDHLRAAGHDVTYMAEIAAGASDVETIIRAQTESRLLLTEDKDFGELVFRRMRAVPGLVLLRIDPERRTFKWPSGCGDRQVRSIALGSLHRRRAIAISLAPARVISR